MQFGRAENMEPLEPGNLNRAANEAIQEVYHQDQLARAGRFHGTHIMPGGPDMARLAVLAEEFGEVSHEVTEGMMDSAYPNAELRKELVQVAAVTIAWIAALDEGR